MYIAVFKDWYPTNIDLQAMACTRMVYSGFNGVLSILIRHETVGYRHLQVFFESRKIQLMILSKA